MKKVFGVIAVVIIILIAIYVVARILPSKTIKSIVGSDNAISEVACSYPVKVSGNSMQDYFKEGELASFDKCFENSELVTGTIVVFKDRDNNRIGIIQEIVDGTLKVKQSNRDAVFTIDEKDIIAVFNK